MKVLKIAINYWTNDSRDKRELSVYRELGEDVLVMAKGEPGDHFREDNVDGFRVLRFSTKPLGSKFPKGFNHVISLVKWSCYARKLNPDVISGHDIHAVAIGWLSSWFRKIKPKLIYDSHEFELGRNTGGRRGKLGTWLIAKEERFLMKRCVFSIMVNDSIADEVQNIHKLEQRPVVVRNVTPYWTVDEEECLKVRRKLCSSISGDTDTFLLMYHGVVTSGRGIENVIDVAKELPKVGVVILGNLSLESYGEQLRKYVADRGMNDRVIFHEAVSFEHLKSYVGAVDVGMIISDVPSKSYYFGLPNKFFENIQALTPVVVTSLPEMERIVKQYDIGLVCPVGDIEAARDAVKRLENDKELYKLFKKNLLKAKEDLCWEKEKKILKAAYLKYVLRGVVH